MTCCTNGDCCGPGSYCCANTGPHEHPELSELLVVIHPKQRDHQGIRDHTRPASPSEVVAAARQLEGAEEQVRPHPTGGWPQKVLVIPLGIEGE